MIGPRRDRAGWVVAILFVVASLVGLYWVVTDSGTALFDLLRALDDRVAQRPLITAITFCLLFIVSTALTLPTATLLCLAAGYLFGTAAGAAISIVGALGGAMVTFVTVRFIAGEKAREFFLRGRARKLVGLLERDAFFYLMSLRVVPVAPFFAINAAGAMIRVSTARFALATTIGLVPLTLIYTSVGASIDVIVDARELATFEILLQPRVAGPLLSVIGVLIAGLLARRWLRRRKWRREQPSKPVAH